MGWASGSSLLMQVWSTVREHVPERDRVATLAALMRVFARSDCDTLDEVIQPEWPESEPAYELYSANPR